MTQCVLLVPVFRFGSFRFFSSSSVICSESVISTIQQTKHHFCRFFSPLDWFLFDCIVAVVVRLYIKHFTPPSKSNRWRRQAANASPHKPHAHNNTEETDKHSSVFFFLFLLLSVWCCCYYEPHHKKRKGKREKKWKRIISNWQQTLRSVTKDVLYVLTQMRATSLHSHPAFDTRFNATFFPYLSCQATATSIEARSKAF